MRWISVQERLPETSGRYLIYETCERKIHTLLAYDWPYPCCDVNIAYFNFPNHWHYSSRSDQEPNKITHWMPLPELPKENE